MLYRRLGSAGVKLSLLSFGTWVTFQHDLDLAIDILRTAYDAGVNFFDTAEAYAAGRSEEVLGEALKKLGWPRITYSVSTKFYWGLKRGVNDANTLNRKYLMQAIDGSLKRLQLDYVDLVFCHRPDPDTPIEETVRAMSDMVTQGKAVYWGTSMWSADQIMQAWQIAERHHLHKPQMEQPEYSLLERDRVEKEYARLYKEIGLGATVWSPLAGGVLTGKYLDGVPDGARASRSNFAWLKEQAINPAVISKVRALQPIAADLGLSLAQLALAWCMKNPNVSTVMTGASSVAHVHENLKALDAMPLLTPDVMARIEAAVT